MEIDKKEGEELFTRTPIKDSPFHMVKNNTDNTYFVVMGRYKISSDCKTEKEAISAINPMTWDNVVLIISACIDAANNQK